MKNAVFKVVIWCIVCCTAVAHSGVVVEGSASGIEDINTVKYLPENNSFIINNSSHQLKILLIHHKKFDKWMVPGGHIEPFENPIEATIRETKEETGLEFASLNEGVMHACGHDMHTTMLIGAAEILKPIPAKIKIRAKE